MNEEEEMQHQIASVVSNTDTTTDTTTTSKKPSFALYPKHFQTNLVKLIIEDRIFASQMQEVLELSYFEQDYLKIIVENVFQYKDKYGTHPCNETIDMLFSNNLKSIDYIKRKEINTFWENFKKNSKVEDAEYYMKIALDFCRSQKVLAALRENFEQLKNAEIDGFLESITKAASLGSSQNFGHDYKEDLEKRYSKDHREPITTGWPLLDKYTKGGIGLGELWCYVAPPSSGKTSREIYTAVANLRLGNNVAFFEAEMSETDIGQMFDSCLTEIHREELIHNQDAIRLKLEELPGKLRIIEEEYCGTTPRRIFSKCKKLEDSGFKIDLVVIDYADIIIPTKTLYHDDGLAGGVQVYSEIKTLTKRYGYRVLTAAQTNRKGAEAEIITPEHFEGMFKRFNPCHFVVGFSKFGKVSPLKTRIGKPFLLQEQKDLGRMQMTLHEISDEGEDVEKVAHAVKGTKSNKELANTLNNFIRNQQSKDK